MSSKKQIYKYSEWIEMSCLPEGHLNEVDDKERRKPARSKGEKDTLFIYSIDNDRELYGFVRTLPGVASERVRSGQECAPDRSTETLLLLNAGHHQEKG